MNSPYISLADLSTLFQKFSVNNLLKVKGYQNKPLTFDEAYVLGVFALAAHTPLLQNYIDMPPDRILIQSVAALCAFHNRAVYEQEAGAAQIAGVCAAIFDYDIGMSAKSFLHPVQQEVMDNCGMGGDLYRTPNLSTIAALIAAADGIPVLKHGSPGNTDSTGSSDFLAHCGVELFPEKHSVEAALAETCFGYTDALDQGYKVIHTNTHHHARLAHMNDIIGPITNPVHPVYMEKRVLGVNHLIPPERVAQAYVLLNSYGLTNLQRGLFVRGFADRTRRGGIDEVGLLEGGTVVAEMNDTEIRTYDLFAQDFGMEEITIEELHPGICKAETSRQILSGTIKDGRRKMAVANAALLFYLDRGMPLSEGVNRAEDLLDSGKPYQTLVEYAQLVRRRE